jgi:hypothetical protein
MAKFRRKPIVIDAVQWDGLARVRGMCDGAVCGLKPENWSEHVHTMHDGQMVELTPGDWIIPEPDGVHFYPCKPEVFSATYEPA